jgi:hypothetical protein
VDLNQWEPIIQKIVAESNHEPNAARKRKLLTEWRAKLEKEPMLLQPFQIDEIVREVRQRLDNPSR